MRQERIGNNLGRRGLQWNRSNEFRERVGDDQDVLMAGIGLQQGPEEVYCHERYGFSSEEEPKIKP